MKHVSIYECPLEKIMYVRPVIFIPGIMGSKLQNAATKEVAWEPDDGVTWAVADHAYLDAEDKRAALIGPPTRHEFDSNFLEIFYDPIEDEVIATESMRQSSSGFYSKEDKKRLKKWSGLAQSYYGEYLQSIEGAIRLKEKNNIWCYQRVYAHPYNWTASNQTSAERLAKTVDYAIKDTQKWIDRLPQGITAPIGGTWEEKDIGTVITTMIPLKPIIVTHSMGGLVSRGYTQSDNRANADKIAGVLHIAMPTDGSPNAYANMLAGSDANYFTRRVLGKNQKQVTATAGNMPGALELLPNHVYKNSKGQKATKTTSSSGWLQIFDQDGMIDSSWPNAVPPDSSDYTVPEEGEIPGGDPYSQIYINQNPWWRLIYKEYLNPKGDDDDAAFMACRRSILNARRFHIQINKHGKFHPNTRMLYSDSAAEEFQACEAVRWNLTKSKPSVPENAKVESNKEGRIEFVTYHRENNPYYPGAVSSITHAVYTMARIKAPGDATVHMGAAAYEKEPLTEPTENGFNHTNAFFSSEVKAWIQKQLRTMAEEEISCMPVS